MIKKSTRGIQSIFWRQMEWVSLASLFIPPCGEFPFQPRKTVILKTVIFSGKTLQLENGKAETSGNFSCMDPTTKIQRRWQNLTLNLFKPQYPQTNSSQWSPYIPLDERICFEIKHFPSTDQFAILITFLLDYVLILLEKIFFFDVGHILGLKEFKMWIAHCTDQLK